MANLLEEFLDYLNSNLFLREFTFSKNQFIPDDATELEFADYVVWLDDLLMIFQLKQRESPSKLDENSERNWFKKKVIRKGSSQIRDTLSYLQRYPSITVKNNRNHEFNLAATQPQRIIKLIIYLPSEALPQDCWDTHHHKSSTGGGFIHLLPWNDYLGISQYLITPPEISAYFEFREEIIKQSLASSFSIPSEKALVGYFLSGSNDPPEEKYSDYLRTLKREDFDISGVLYVWGDRIDRASQDKYNPTDYYAILKEFAKLHRVELREVKERWVLCLNAVQADMFRRPTRIVASNGCGFVFIPTESRMFAYRQQGLMNFTLAAKYDLRLERQIGILFAKEQEEILIDFCLLDFPWKYDQELEKYLTTHNPFAPMTNAIHRDYQFED